MREITLGQYYPVKSVLHEMDARIKLILMIAYIVMVFFVDTFIAYGLVFLFLLFVIAISKVPLLKAKTYIFGNRSYYDYLYHHARCAY